MRFEALDGWRGIAALLVALYHLPFLNHLYNTSLIRNSFLFVDFFFVLSGFVIGHAYLKRLNNKKEIGLFIFRRIGRLWPLHIFVLLLFVLMEFLKIYVMTINGEGWQQAEIPFSNEYSLRSLVSNIFLLQSIGLHDQLTWNYPSWSISVEFYTYLVFIFVIALLHINRLIKVGIVLFSLWVLYLYPKNIDATFDFGLFRCMAGFFLGLLIYSFYESISLVKLRFATFIEVSIIVLVILFVLFFSHGLVSLLAPFLFSIMVMVFALEQGAVSKVLRSKPFQKLGLWSYSIYMIHAFVILVISRVIAILEPQFDFKMYLLAADLGNPLGVDAFYINSLYFMDILTLLYVFIVIVCASILYKVVEVNGVLIFKRIEKNIL